MKRPLPFMILLVCVGATFADDVKTTPDRSKDKTRPVRKTFVLPADGQAEVITLNRVGGCEFGVRRNDDKVLTVTADGTVRVGAPYEYAARAKGKITRDEVQELLRFIALDQKFFEITTDKLEQERGGRRYVTRCPEATSVIMVHADGKRHEARCHALSIRHARSPEMQLAARLRAIELRLERLAGMTQLGGEEELAKHLQTANAKLAAADSKQPPLGMADFHWARVVKNGKFTIDFAGASGKQKQTFVRVMRLSNGEVKSFVEERPAKPGK